MKTNITPEYDERQMLEPGRGFQLAFVTLLLTLGLSALLETLTSLTLAPEERLLICLWVPSAALYTYLIRKNAYLGLGKAGSTYGFLAQVIGLAGVVVLIIWLVNWLGQGMTPLAQGGQLAKLISGLSMLIIGIVYLAHQRKEKRLGKEAETA